MSIKLADIENLPMYKLKAEIFDIGLELAQIEARHPQLVEARNGKMKELELLCTPLESSV